MAILSKIFGDANARYIKSLQPIVDRINELEKDYEKLSDSELKEKTAEFKNLLTQGWSLDDILPEAFAAVREASKRTLGQRHFDVQLMGGITLHRGNIAEMKTGEGKTLVATLAVYLNALPDSPSARSGGGVHVVTVNDYLSRRDAVWMGQIYNALGLTTGCINHESSYLYDPSFAKASEGTVLDETRDLTGSFHVVHEFLKPVTRREAYLADITYGTNNEYGFDYLRDNMAYEELQMAQAKGHNFAIVDEVDSILIDEARTPLIISAPDEDSGKLYETFSKIVPHLKENEDYNVDEKLKAVSITESGIEKVEKALGLTNIYDEGGTRHVHHMEQALKAQILFKRDRDYVVKNGEVIIVDEFTGRLMPGRRWSEGLHQAVEAKEGVKIEKESKTLATITFQNYFRLYKKLAGMTGTAQSSAEEFHKVYKLDSTVIPTNKPMIRKDMPDRIYKTEAGKLRAIVREIKELHEKGQPVLVGTVSIEKNEMLSLMLEKEGIPHNVLNAKQHEKEAEMHAQAGRPGGVTVATNMAGRGVDIILGGNPPNPENARRARDMGGLHVIGTERHEARRIDDQLRGRAGRQGDPGSSRFFVSVEDELVRVFGGDKLKNLMDRLGVGEDDVIENRFVSSAIAQAQSRIEGHNFDIRKYVLEYDDVMNKHREAVYRLRKEVVLSESAKKIVLDYLRTQIMNLVNFHTQGQDYKWNIEEIGESLKALLPVDDEINVQLVEVAKAGNKEKLTEFIVKKAEELYEAREKDMGAESVGWRMRRLEKLVLLRTIDELWMDHIEAMEYLRDSVRLRAYGQRDPLVEYKIEGQNMYNQLMVSIGAQVANLIFKVSFVEQPKIAKLEEKRLDIIGDSAGHAHQPVINEPTHREKGQNIGRNDPCWCGSGKKFKRCHGA
ncbi:MAG: preprotein translocase subunit SecA [Candidatus Yanofskybacteria bacterium RIFCSPLOWO2_01_FULL_41_34]|uniref:Protein translocase subunit SecA n=1 Tax=Candidatus Yanofskybacteria bacterium RIFCSPHIGHO2_01_FULL_41_26 TaxID=1802661 RepID=A0A1F8EDM4_9BACT|nr:MAG: preprotein translocase subunit SecA [Candidatus Yanofskybacteria bacterium RIFCSPHIGHO2_01_FULL_41_26]OGN20998.1 MAG: preprotein translocase subunit SecA [Candidatus Yanofskybacteria bacterium RIFCSPLOWO2_01_FULL_41_34]